MKRQTCFLVLLLAVCLAATSCVPSDIDIAPELGPETLARIDAVNQTLATGLEIGPETRDLIGELSATIQEGAKVGFDEATLQRIDELLRVIEDKTIEIGIEIGPETLGRVDELLEVIDNAPDQWEETATEIIRTLESSAGTAAARVAREVEQIIDKARTDAEHLVAIGGIEFRCNVDFLGARAGSTINQFIGRSILGRLRAILKGEPAESAIPIPWVCHIQPDRIKLTRVGDRIFYKEGVIIITGYDYVDANLPQTHVVDERGKTIDAVQLFPFRTSAYQLEVNLDGIDLSGVPDRSRVEFRWPNVTDKTAIAILMPGPQADFSANRRSGTAPLTVRFRDLSEGEPQSWKWEFGDGETSTKQNPEHRYVEAGRYTVKLTATNPQGSDQEEKSGYIVVEEPPPAPTARFDADPRQGTAPLPVQFFDRSAGNPTGWEWKFGDGQTSSLQNPAHLYAKPGIYKVSLTVSNAQGSDTKTENAYIDVKARPPRPAPPPPPAPLFSSDAVYFHSYHDLGGNLKANTRIPTSKYDCGIVGMAVIGGDIAEEGDGDILLAYMYEEGNTWWIRADLNTSDNRERWHIYMMCIDKAYEKGYQLLEFNDLGDDVTEPTSVSAADYTCGIVGMAAWDGDINEEGDGDILRAYMYVRGDEWYIRADFRTHTDHESWDIDALCVKNEDPSLYSRAPWLYRKLTRLDDTHAYDTGIPFDDYTCGIVGMAALDGDIDENTVGGPLLLVHTAFTQSWAVMADFRSHNDAEEWDIYLLCASNEIARTALPR